MWKYFLAASISTTFAVGGYGQIKKQFSVEDREQVSKIELHLSAKSGNCYIRPSQNSDLLNVYSNQDIVDYGHAFRNEVNGNVATISLALEQEGQRGVGQKISYQVFGGDQRPSDKFWKVYLTENKPYNLSLDYGLGNANIDLSGLSIHQLKIKTGSADVNVFYGSGAANQIEMDTFFVKVDMGSLNVKQLNLARSRVVMADVGFGNILLDFSDKPSNSNHVKGSVGAGNFVILLPGKDTPVKVKISNSWLCSLDLCKSLKRVSENTFVNEAFTKGDKDALTFDLDVSLGKIVFKDKSE